MNKFFEEYGFVGISMISGCIFIGLLFKVFVGRHSLFSMLIHTFLGAFMT